jgi:hypothetical protein
MPSNLVLQAFLIRFSCFLACTAEIIREIRMAFPAAARGIMAWAAAGRFPNAAMRMIGRGVVTVVG